jgi:hypothetical protein
MLLQLKLVVETIEEAVAIILILKCLEAARDNEN